MGAVMGFKCCKNGQSLICGGPGAWGLNGNEPSILFCPWCGKELPKTAVMKFEVVVRYNRGLGSEFKKYVLEALNFSEAKAMGEKTASEELEGYKNVVIVGSQATIIKE
jgi:hypothetical protein